MSLLFLIYALAFWFVHARKKNAAFVSLAVAVASSVAMYFYHADSSLGLNF